MWLILAVSAGTEGSVSRSPEGIDRRLKPPPSPWRDGPPPLPHVGVGKGGSKGVAGKRGAGVAGKGEGEGGQHDSAWCQDLAGWAPGFCPQGQTGVSETKDANCETTPTGYWRDVLSAADCAFRCEGCVLCRIVSYSPVDNTCSWHWEQSSCSVGELKQAGTGHCSATVGEAVHEARREGPVNEPAGRCLPLSRPPELAPSLLPPKMVPQHLYPALIAPATAVANAHLRGKCFLLLGDSTMAETATDLGLVLGTSLINLERELRRLWGWNETTSPSRAKLNGNTFRFHPSTRNMTIVSPEHDAIVYHRFVAHPAPTLVGNFKGINSLHDVPLRHEIEASATRLCGTRDRVLWLQAGYHDVAGNGALAQAGETAATTRNKWATDASAALTWLEGLAPERSWLSRHVGKNVWTDPSKLEHLVHHKLLPNRSQPWTHSDHREAWACEGAGTIARRRGADSDYFDGVGLHLVHEDRGKRQDHGEVLRQAQAAAEKRVVDRAPATQKFYLSMLRTLQALTHTYASHNHIRQHTELKRAPLQADHRDARAAWRAAW